MILTALHPRLSLFRISKLPASAGSLYYIGGGFMPRGLGPRGFLTDEEK